MKLEVGKRYVLRNGEVTEPLEETSDPVHKFAARAKNIVKRTWTESGHWLDGSTDKDLDIVAEYVEPQPQQPLRWVENCVPDKPGIWAYKNGLDETRVAFFDADDIQTCHLQQCCYLGPIPEILPPKRKVVERLWIDYCESHDSKVLFRWFAEGETIQPSGNWVRTDETREREI